MKPRTWALVMDGMRARILRRLDSVDGEDPVEMVSKAASVHLRDIMADTLERGFSTDQGSGQAVRAPDDNPIRHDMEEFARDTLSYLEAHHRSDDFERLAIFAAPAMLGVLRMELPAGLKRILMMDSPLNLISLPERELRDRVLHLIHENDKHRST